MKNIYFADTKNRIDYFCFSTPGLPLVCDYLLNNLMSGYDFLYVVAGDKAYPFLKVCEYYGIEKRK